jgi:GTPase SAR1 family protein
MRLKIVVAGPKGTGKTSISNLLSGHSEPQGLTSTNEPEPYNPTAGVRILECEFHDESVELWDMSGDQIYEGCWKAIMQV